METNSLKPCNHIPVPEGFEIEIADYLKSRNEKSEIVNYLCEKRYHTKDTGLPARVLSHWADSGIIDSTKSLEATGWREYSFLDLLWIDVVVELRVKGLSFAQIQKSYQTLHNLSYHFEAGSALALENKPIFLIVHKDGTCQLASREMIAIFLNLSLPNLRTITLISLNQIIERSFPEAITSIKPTNLSSKFSDEEVRLIFALRDPLVKEANIILNNGVIERFELHKSADNEIDEEKLKKLAKDIQFARIETIKKGGMEKIKLKESIKI